MTYTRFPRGSEWRKWDLHIHTPDTKKNDQFSGANSEEKWKNYINDINTSTEDISVIGITDYFCIDNYFKFKLHVQSGTITKKFDLIVPNIELRITPVTASSTPINIHCIFNPEIDNEIESRFLGKLKFNYGGSNFSARKDELIRLGKALPGNSAFDSTSALKAGISQYVVGITDLIEVFEKDKSLRDNVIIVVSNKSTDGVTGITKHSDFFISQGQSQLDATRWGIYQFSDAIFSSNEGDILYFTGLGPDKRENVIEKCASLMPCFHGCDAHENSKIFKPDANRFCWIKADPTFEGLKQTLYEPTDRVKIQSIKPDLKNDRHVISELKFIDAGSLFGNRSILLNDNLNAIIGGKSSGKSLLLYASAKSIDPLQVENASKRLDFEGYKFNSAFDFKVIWKNGDEDTYGDSNTSDKNHKIIYIPQLYINYLVEKNNKEELNSLIKNILLQDSQFKDFHDHNVQLRNNINNDLETLLSSYLQTRLKLIDVQKQSKEIGRSDAINASIQNLEKRIAEAQKLSNLDEREAKNYNGLMLEQSRLEKLIADLTNKENVLNKVLSEVQAAKANLLGKASTETTYTIKGQIDRFFDELTAIPAEFISLKDGIEVDYNVLIANLNTRIEEMKIPQQKQEATQLLNQTNVNLNPYLVKLSGQKELQNMVAHLQKEKQKLDQAQNLEKQNVSLLKDYEDLRKQTAALIEQRILRYREIVDNINSTKNDIGSGITLNASLIYKLENFALYTQANKAAISGSHYFHSLVNDNTVRFEALPELYSQFLRVADDKLYIDSNRTIPLKQQIKLEEILRGLIADNFEIDYTVTYKGDDLLKMSPGKKGTVLLILFLQISSSEFPILIDQPEDNLDNRTIYDLLCQMIKTKKKERQILIVSHNANLVVATDTENVIVANQEGQETPIGVGRTRFEYVNGSIEHSFLNNQSNLTILTQQGIKEHVCDILEGGNEAFKQREKKYNIK